MDKRKVFKFIGGIVLVLSLVFMINNVTVFASSFDNPAADINVGQTITFSIPGGGKEYVRFTAPEDGMYVFGSLTDYSLYPQAKIYKYDEGTGKYTFKSWAYDVGDGTHQIEYEFEAEKGDTIWLELSFYNCTTMESMAINCYRKYDISKLKFRTFANHKYREAAFSIDNFIRFEEKLESEITFDTSYKIAGDIEESDYKDGVPSEIGYYIIRLKGTGVFYGEITFGVTIWDAYDLNKYDDYNCFWYEYTGSEISADSFNICGLYDSTQKLTLGKDYKIMGYKIYGTFDFLTPGLPKDIGEYSIQLQGIAPYYNVCTFTIKIVDINDLENYKCCDFSVYDGTEMGFNGAYIYLDYLDKNSDYKRNVLKAGEDFEVIKYHMTYESEVNSVEGAPTEVGDYKIYVAGKGKYSGNMQYKFDIEKPEDKYLIDITKVTAADLKASGIDVELVEGGLIYYKIKPAVSGTYRIYTEYPQFVSADDSVEIQTDTNGCLYDAQGRLLQENDDGPFEQTNMSLVYYLEEGKEYYVGIREVYNRAELTVLCITGDGIVYQHYDDATKEGGDKKEEGNKDKDENKNSQPLKKGTKFKIGKDEYKVTSSKAGAPEVAYNKNLNKKAKTKTVKATVKYQGVTYKVTSISAKAFYKNTKLKKITIKSKTLKKVGKNAIKGINKKATIKGPKLAKKKQKAFRKKFTKKTGFIKKTMKLKF